VLIARFFSIDDEVRVRPFLVLGPNISLSRSMFLYLPPPFAQCMSGRGWPLSAGETCWRRCCRPRLSVSGRNYATTAMTERSSGADDPLSSPEASTLPVVGPVGAPSCTRSGEFDVRTRPSSPWWNRAMCASAQERVSEVVLATLRPTDVRRRDPHSCRCAVGRARASTLLPDRPVVAPTWTLPPSPSLPVDDELSGRPGARRQMTRTVPPRLLRLRGD